MIYVGTSGFSYKEWEGSFYPEKLGSGKYLEYYSQRLKTTELNNTFYRFPSEKYTVKWAEQVPDDFRFALKLNQRITHRKRLRGVGEEMGWFLTGAMPLGEKLGCILVQLPPNLRQDAEALEAFLAAHARNVPLAFEFRHDSWAAPEIFELLRRHKASWCVAETDDSPALREVTAPFCYLRLRKSDYSDEELAGWAKWLQSLTGDSFVYFKHELGAPRLALRLVEQLK